MTEKLNFKSNTDRESSADVRRCNFVSESQSLSPQRPHPMRLLFLAHWWFAIWSYLESADVPDDEWQNGKRGREKGKKREAERVRLFWIRFFFLVTILHISLPPFSPPSLRPFSLSFSLPRLRRQFHFPSSAFSLPFFIFSFSPSVFHRISERGSL